MELKKFRYYETNYLDFWILSAEGSDSLNEIDISIQGDELNPDEVWLSFAYDIFNNHWESVVKLAQDRLRVWGESIKKDFQAEAVYFGDYPYGPEQEKQSGFRITLKTIGNDCEDVYGEYTISFNQNIYPIGYEFSIA